MRARIAGVYLSAIKPNPARRLGLTPAGNLSNDIRMTRLRMLTIDVTMLVIAWGWYHGQVRIVHERDQMVHAPLCRGYWSWGHRDPEIPWIRRWLGDHAYSSVSLDDSATDKDVERYRARFPEARVDRLSGGGS